jgi:hypothetical protein
MQSVSLLFMQARSLPTDSLRPAFLITNAAVYVVQVSCCRERGAVGRQKGGMVYPTPGDLAPRGLLGSCKSVISSVLEHAVCLLSSWKDLLSWAACAHPLFPPGGVQLVIWVTMFLEPGLHRTIDMVAKLFFALVSLGAAAGFLLYGGRSGPRPTALQAGPCLEEDLSLLDHSFHELNDSSAPALCSPCSPCSEAVGRAPECALLAAPAGCSSCCGASPSSPRAGERSCARCGQTGPSPEPVSGPGFFLCAKIASSSPALLLCLGCQGRRLQWQDGPGWGVPCVSPVCCYPAACPFVPAPLVPKRRCCLAGGLCDGHLLHLLHHPGCHGEPAACIPLLQKTHHAVYEPP